MTLVGEVAEVEGVVGGMEEGVEEEEEVDMGEPLRFREIMFSR